MPRIFRRAHARTIALVALVATSACTDPAQPEGRNSLGSYGFLIERDDQFHVLDGSGRPLRTVLPAGVAGFMPDVSTDGSRIAFIHPARLADGTYRLEVATIGIDGSGFRVVTATTESALQPRWAPDALGVAYSMSSTAEPFAYFDDLVVRSLLPGGGVVHLIESPHDQAGAPTWSTSGDRIAFERADMGLWVVRADGTGLQQLTTGRDGNPDWAPDGTRIAFERIANGSRQVCILVLATEAERCFGIHGWGSHPRWSPAGEWLALIGNDGGLYTVDRDGESPIERVPGWRMQGTDYDWMRLR